MNVERSDSSGIASLIFALELGVMELMSVALSQHSRGAVKIREIGALKRSREMRTDESGQGEGENEKNKRLHSRDDCQPASCIRGEHAAAVYRRCGRSATANLHQRSSRLGMSPFQRS